MWAVAVGEAKRAERPFAIILGRQYLDLEGDDAVAVAEAKVLAEP